MDNFLFTKEESVKLFDDNISVREQKSLLEKADSRLVYIVQTLEKIIGREWDWFDYSNENSSGNGRPDCGYFDPEDYAKTIRFVGKFHATKNKDFSKYDGSFPTNWLWTDFEADLHEEVSAFEAKGQAVKQQQLNVENQIKTIEKEAKSLQEKIYQNIPPEMRNSFTLKSPEQIYRERMNDSNPEYQAAKKLLQSQENQIRKILSAEDLEFVQFKKPEDLLQRNNHKKLKH